MTSFNWNCIFIGPIQNTATSEVRASIFEIGGGGGRIQSIALINTNKAMVDFCGEKQCDAFSLQLSWTHGVRRGQDEPSPPQ